MSIPTTDPKVRFTEKYCVCEATGCWEWTAARKPNGYGNFMMRKADGKGVFVNAHKASWLLHKGPVPAGLCVLHSCDNPGCVNPSHLFIGTHKNNSEDMLAKGRGGPVATGGEAHPISKLTNASVKAIRTERAAGAQLKEIAARYSVAQSTISLVCAGKTWKAAGGPVS